MPSEGCTGPSYSFSGFKSDLDLGLDLGFGMMPNLCFKSFHI